MKRWVAAAVLFILWAAAGDVKGQVGFRTDRLQVRERLEVSPDVASASIWNSYIAYFNGQVLFNKGLVLGDDTQAIAGKIRFSGGRFLGYNGVKWVYLDSTTAGGSSAAAFTDLTDTPGQYSGAGAYLLRVNSGATGIEFVSPSLVTADAGWIRGKLITGTPPADGQILKYDSASDEVVWANETGGGASALNDLSDVTLTSPAALNILGYDGAAWKNLTATDLGLSTTGHNHNLADLADVDQIVPNTDDYIYWNGTQFTYGKPSFLLLTDTPASYSANSWIRVNSAGSALEFFNPSLGDMTDVNLQAGVTDSDILQFSGVDGAFIPRTLSEAGIAPASHTHTESDITDLYHNAVAIRGKTVTTTAPTDGNVLKYNATSGQIEWATDATGAGATDFTGLADTPSSYAGFGSYLLRVNAGETAVEFVDPTTISTDALSIRGTAVTTAAPTDGYVLKYNSASGQIEWAADAGGTGATEFTGLTDTPSSYTGFGNTFVKVNAGETGIEFVSGSLTEDDLTDNSMNDLQDVNYGVSPAQGDFLKYGLGVWEVQSGITKGDLVNTGSLGFQWATSELAPAVMEEGENVSLLTNDAGYAQKGVNETITGTWTFNNQPVMPLVIQANVVNPDSLFLEGNQIMVWENTTGRTVTVDEIKLKTTRTSGYHVTVAYTTSVSSSSPVTILDTTVNTAGGGNVFYTTATTFANNSILANYQVWLICDTNVDVGQLFFIMKVH